MHVNGIEIVPMPGCNIANPRVPGDWSSYEVSCGYTPTGASVVFPIAEGWCAKMDELVGPQSIITFIIDPGPVGSQPVITGVTVPRDWKWKGMAVTPTDIRASDCAYCGEPITDALDMVTTVRGDAVDDAIEVAILGVFHTQCGIAKDYEEQQIEEYSTAFRTCQAGVRGADCREQAHWVLTDEHGLWWFACSQHANFGGALGSTREPLVPWLAALERNRIEKDRRARTQLSGENDLERIGANCREMLGC